MSDALCLFSLSLSPPLRTRQRVAMRAALALPGRFLQSSVFSLRPGVSTRALSMGTRAAENGRVLVTWDIDGTLLLGKGKGGNAAHKRALEDGVAAVHGIRVAVNDVAHAGSTDRAIIRDMCVFGGVSAAAATAKMEAVIAVADAAIARLVADGGGLQGLVLPGVRAALEALQNAGAALALTTGNLESCAWTKLRAAKLDHFFSVGGFGSDCFHRSDILKKAIGLVVATDGGLELLRDGRGNYTNVFHVGDAVADMAAARDNRARGVGVLTGSFSREQLQREEPYVVLEDLSDTKAFLELLGVKQEVAQEAAL